MDNEKTNQLDTYFYSDQTNGSESREFSAEFIAAGIEALTRLRREWQRDLDLARSELREIQSSARNLVLEMRNESLQLQTIMREQVTARLTEVKDGRQGPSGERGEKGERGEPGEKGEPGDRGERGEPGELGREVVGKTGEKGEPGDKGERGEKGEPGDRGERGEKGDPGEKGDKGISGEAGAPGERGEAGSAGLPGRDGSNGERGEKGERGEPGIDGKDGERGEPGRRGQRGEKGEIGDMGPAGERGEDGKSFRHRGTYDPDVTDYLALDYVVLDHTVFTAKIDNPGPCPGSGWQSGPCGKKGDKGLPGDRGPRGHDAPLWAGVELVDGWTLTARMSDGSAGPQVDLRSVLTGIRVDRSTYSLVLGDDLRLSLRELFEQYDQEKNGK
jgi:hypothetical protein